jgi:hypothetical protein
MQVPTPLSRPGPVAIALDALAAAADDRAGIEHRQCARWAALQQAAAKVPRHARWLAGRDATALPLARWPVATKTELMRDFEAGLADPSLTLAEVRAFCADASRVGQPLRGGCWVWQSSGSSGEPGTYVQDATAMAVYDALEATRRHSPRPGWRLFDPWYLGERFAFVGATTGHFASYVSVQRLRRLQP